MSGEFGATAGVDLTFLRTTEGEQLDRINIYSDDVNFREFLAGKFSLGVREPLIERVGERVSITGHRLDGGVGLGREPGDADCL